MIDGPSEPLESLSSCAGVLELRFDQTDETPQCVHRVLHPVGELRGVLTHPADEANIGQLPLEVAEPCLQNHALLRMSLLHPDRAARQEEGDAAHEEQEAALHEKRGHRSDGTEEDL